MRHFALYMAMLLAVGFLGMTVVAWAQQNYPRDISLTWLNPTMYEDGSDIQPGDLRGTRLSCVRDGDGLEVVALEHANVAGPGEQETEQLVGVIPRPGVYRCLAFAVTVDSLESTASNEASKRYTGRPLPPAILIAE